MSERRFQSDVRASGQIYEYNLPLRQVYALSGTGGASSSSGGGIGELHRNYVPAGETMTISGRQQVLVYGSYEEDPGSTLVIQPSGALVVLESGPPILTITASGQVMFAHVLLNQTISASQASFSISGLAASGYDYIEIEMLGRTDNAGASDHVNINFNGDTNVANYRSTYHYAGSAHNFGDADARDIGEICGATAGATSFGALKATIPAPGSAQMKALNSVSYARETTTTSNYIFQFGVQWENVAAINYLALTPLAGSNFVSGTYCQIKGFKSQWVIASGSYGPVNIANGMLVP